MLTRCHSRHISFLIQRLLYIPFLGTGVEINREVQYTGHIITSGLFNLLAIEDFKLIFYWSPSRSSFVSLILSVPG